MKKQRKILISWLAKHNDFVANLDGTSGPNYNFHKYHFDHDVHILLYTPDTFEIAFRLRDTLRRDFPKHLLDFRKINVQNVGNLTEVKTKVEDVLLEFADYEIDLFFSPGAPMMQISWYICHTTLGLKTNLIQLIRLEYSRSETVPDLVRIETDFSDIPRSAILRQNFLGKPIKQDSDFFLTKTLTPVYALADKIAQTDHVSVLITGETGTGKEHLARYIHKVSVRANKPFEALNCAGFTDELLESRLFGHKKGTFTGAISDQAGIFKTANGGTIFLDEIGDITPYMQQLLLRVLQEKEIRPIGGKAERIDVRIVSATNKNLHKLMSEGKFRSDLFYRLAVTDLHVPSLENQTIDDKLALIDYFLETKQKRLRKPQKLVLSKALADFLRRYRFAGNIRELENLIERLYVFSTDNQADIDLLPAHIQAEEGVGTFSLADVERAHILKTYAYFGENKTHTADALGLSVNTLKFKLRSYGHL